MAERKVVKKREEKINGTGVDAVAGYVRKEYATMLDKLYNPEKYKVRVKSESRKLESELDLDDEPDKLDEHDEHDEHYEHDEHDEHEEHEEREED